MINQKLNSTKQEIENTEENNNWKNFKNKSDEIITKNEVLLDDFKKNKGRIPHKLKPDYSQKVTELEENIDLLKNQMNDFIQERTNRQEKFTNDFSRKMNELG